MCFSGRMTNVLCLPFVVTENSLVSTKVQVSTFDDKGKKGKKGDNGKKGDGKGKTADGPALDLCKFFVAGTCHKGDDCRWPHTKKQAAAKASGQQRQPKGSEKGKPRSKSRPPSKKITKEDRESMAKMDCPDYAGGTCRWGEKCFKKHGQADDPMTRVPCLIVQLGSTSCKAQRDHFGPSKEDLCLDTGTGALKSALKCTFISYTQRPSNTDATPAMIMGISTHKCCHVKHHKLIFAEAFEHGHICNRVNNGTFELLRMLKYEKPYFELMNV